MTALAPQPPGGGPHLDHRAAGTSTTGRRTHGYASVPRSEPEPGESSCYGLGLWLQTDSPRITMSGADAGVSFWSTYHPDHGT
ncbi:MAG TPA: hypothetical protein VFW27_08590, partial [Actinoplanes sp.]|nr:hypothetical protein [Actinoplanes sp.]